MFTTPEVLAFVAEKVRAAPFEKWSGPVVAALVKERFNFQGVSPTKGREILSLVRKINRRVSSGE